MAGAFLCLIVPYFTLAYNSLHEQAVNSYRPVSWDTAKLTDNSLVGVCSYQYILAPGAWQSL